MKNKKLTNSEEIAKLYTDTYRTRMPLYNDYVFHRIYGSDTEESKAALVGLLNIILERKDDPIRRLEIKNPIDIGRGYAIPLPNTATDSSMEHQIICSTARRAK